MSEQTTSLILPTRRQFLTGGLGLAAAGVLGACGETSGSAAGGGGNKTASYVNKGMDFFFFVVQSEAVKRASKEIGYTFQTTDAKQDASAQYNNWNSALLQRPGMIISDPVDSEGLAPMTKKAGQQKIPVGIIDTPLTKGETDFTVSFDNRKGGELAGQKVADLLKKKYGSVKGTVLNAYGALSSVAWRQRKEGFEAVLKKYPGVKILARPTDGAETKARDVAAATLSEYPDLDAAHAPSGSITRGIVTSMKNAGKAKPVGDDDHIILVSIDGEPQSLQWTRDKILDAEVSQDPVAYGQICVEMLNKYAVAGKEVPLQDYSNKDYFWEKAPIVKGATGPTMVIPPYYIDADNVEDPRQWGNVVIKDWGMKQS